MTLLLLISLLDSKYDIETLYLIFIKTFNIALYFTNKSLYTVYVCLTVNLNYYLYLYHAVQELGSVANGKRALPILGMNLGRQ